MPIEKQFDRISEEMEVLMKKALMRGIKIGYEATKKAVEEKYGIVFEDEDEIAE